jgi:hypothetical protein
LLAVSALAQTASTPAWGQQTRQQCNECCQKMDYDEYYLEQCKLRCFRNPESCVGKQARPEPPRTQQPMPEQASPEQPRPEQAMPVQPPVERLRPEQPRPGQAPTVQPQRPPEQPSPRREQAFQWPSPLDLTPGREWEAAAQILVLNGISTGHPNYLAALRSIEGILIQFARANPQGGKLPTTELQKIIRQFR